MKKTAYITQGAVIAAAYFALCMLVAPIAYGPIQFRVSEALMLLPALTPAGVPGLFVGCLLFNLLNPAALGPIDVIFGSLATLIAAVITRQLVRLKPSLPNLKLNARPGYYPYHQLFLTAIVGYLLFYCPIPPFSINVQYC